MSENPPPPSVRLVREGLAIGDEVVPLLAGSVHYWRLEPTSWRSCLLATKSLGVRIVDTYVPWSVHEVAPGVLELGERDPRRDVGAFLRLVHELGMFAIVRPGPHINAELTCFGIPERVVWDPACQARSPRNNPVVLPMLPHGFPVPSYASQVFFDETARYFKALAEVLRPLLHPHGPIVMLQVDNEGAMYFRDGAYDQDYHPDAIHAYRAFLRDKYKSLGDLAAAYGFDPESEGAPRFGDIEPPRELDAKTPAELARHIDWAEFHEVLLASAMRRFAAALDEVGLTGVPRSHNFPPGQDATPLNAARVQGAIDLIGYDFYNKAGQETRRILARRASELAVRCDALGVPAFGCEMGAGFPPFFPPLDEKDSMFTVLTSLAYGLRGFNIYMAVERDRWIGAPIDPHGRERPFALFWRKLCSTLEAIDFAKLRRHTPARILVPRNERRLARVCHAFGPVSGAFFSVAGAGARESSFEDDFGLGYAPAVEADSFVRLIEGVLDSRGVPFAHVGGEDRDLSLDGARFIVCVSSGGLSPKLHARLCEAAAGGALVTVGPRAPELGGGRRPLLAPLDLAPLAAAQPGFDAFCPNDPARAEALVADAIARLGLPTYASDVDAVFVTVHHDEAGRPRVLFVINPDPSDVTARVTVQSGGAGADVAVATDLLREQTIHVSHGALELTIKGRSVRMLALA